MIKGYKLTEESLVRSIKINQAIDEPELKRLTRLSLDGKLKGRALEWVMNRPRSTRELKDYLYRKKAEPEQITGIADEFQARGYLSDIAFSKWRV